MIDNSSLEYIYISVILQKRTESSPKRLSNPKSEEKRKRTQVSKRTRREKGIKSVRTTHQNTHISVVHLKHHSLLPIGISRISPTSPIRQETQPLLKRAVCIAVAVSVSSRTARPAVHTRPPVKETQPAATGAPGATVLSRLATALVDAAAVRLLLATLLVQAAA